MKLTKEQKGFRHAIVLAQIHARLILLHDVDGTYYHRENNCRKCNLLKKLKRIETEHLNKTKT